MGVSAPRVYLVDASAYVHRAWQQYPTSIRDEQGQAANAVYGFAAFVLDLLERERPERIAFAFDTPESADGRRAIHPPYKRQRPEKPAELRHQFALCRAVAEAAGIAAFARTGFEADDVLATLATNARRHGLRHTVLTGDKDLTQLVRTGDLWRDDRRGLRLDPIGVKHHFGVLPHQIPDLLALAGDASDDIPGVPGIGAATAARLLAHGRDLEAVLADTEAVARMRFRGAPRTAARLRRHAATARLARRLTVTHHDDSLPNAADALRRRRPDWRRWREVVPQPAA